MIHMILLRSLMKAVYQPEKHRTFRIGVSALCPLHVADPPVSRPVDPPAYSQNPPVGSGPGPNRIRRAPPCPRSAKKTSERERAAEDAERESVRIKQLEYLNAHLGDEFVGQISGFLEFGFFVTLNGVGADGLVRFSGIDDDYYIWDKRNGMSRTAYGAHLHAGRFGQRSASSRPMRKRWKSISS